MPNTYENTGNVKKFLDENGLRYFAQKLNDYPTNDVIAAVIEGVQDALDEKVDKTSYSNEDMGQGYGTCSTAAAAIAKEAALNGYALTTGGIVSVRFTYDVPASATLNINNRGAKNLYFRNAAITSGVIAAGDIATFIYDGTQYHLIGIDKAANAADAISDEDIDSLFDSYTPGDNYYKPISAAQIDALFQ